MYFQIVKLVLWPRQGHENRIVQFAPGKLNVITGASKTGKSAVIPIIDYCLGSGKCAIPVGVIRDACSWFGVVVQTIEGEKPFARREPGQQRQTGDMYVLESDKVDVPNRMPQRNTNSELVRGILDRVAGLSQLGFDPDKEGAYQTRPSFRDLMAFIFQPQNILANPDVLFFGADTTEHREKLKTVFPYVLNAVTPDMLAARWELSELQRQLRRLERELQATASTVDVWKAEAHRWLRQAIDLGLLPPTTALPEEWIDILELLRVLTRTTSRSARPTLESIDTSLERLERLRSGETAAAVELSENRQRYNEIRRLLQSSESYGSAIRVQRDRLNLSGWLRSRAETSSDALVQASSQGRQDIDTLCAALEEIEMRVRSHPTMSDTLDKERIRLSASVERSIQRLTQVRQEIAVLEQESEEASESVYRSDQVDRFLGRLEQGIVFYDRTEEDATLQQQISDLSARIEKLRQDMSESDVRRRLKNALRSIESHASSIVPKLDAEWPEAPIRLLINDLTLQVIQGTREDYLWEIGSGANWLAYHVALTLSLQSYFLDQPHHPVPRLLVYDQPSQAYFPRRSVRSEESAEPVWRDEDVVAVRKVFRAVADEVQRAEGGLQVIILDHAANDVWGAVSGVTVVENWRDGGRLVPEEWL